MSIEPSLLNDALLQVDNIDTYYQQSHILQGLSLSVPRSGVVRLLGRNGAGKSTTLRSIMGIVPPRRGSIRFEGEEIAGMPPYRIARRGIAFVPETRGIFPSLSVNENLTLADNAARRDSAWTLERVFELFPQLYERRSAGGTMLSGGEQQMLSIARALLMNPQLLILDEPTEGLAPVIIERISEQLAELKAAGDTMLLVEQNYAFAVSLADQVYILGKGQVRWQGSAAELHEAETVTQNWLGL